MVEPLLHWQIQSPVELPEGWLDLVQQYAGEAAGQYATQLLWQRGIQDANQLQGFLDPQHYQPASPFEFGLEMQWAVERLQQARDRHEKVAIWGDFDADGITSTAVLWDGLGQFFPKQEQLTYYIPNRLTESHGLSYSGLDQLVQQGCQVIVTCDTGSTNLAELQYAQQQGLDVIITDHHTLPSERPPVVALINPRSLPREHPLAHLSGVAVAYTLVEALYQTLPEVPQAPLEDLLDLVAIGLIADLVELRGDCRYLAQLGIARLQRHVLEKGRPSNRPGIARLLELCQRSGDRPTDISFGIGPRINAVSRIHGDASFCVELLTSRDPERCRQLAEETELANARRKALQKDVSRQVADQLAQVDLSTTQVIVLLGTQWPVGILGLVAGQVAQQTGKPTILLNAETPNPSESPAETVIAKGSARSVNQIDLYQLVQEQQHLLHSFGGHPFAAGLSLPIQNVPLFREAINQHLRQINAGVAATAVIQADLIVTVADLGKSLFRELKLLEPYGMGNPIPRLFVRNCWFAQAWNRNIQDWRGGRVRYIKTEFQLWDESAPDGFPGIWWEHYHDELPPGRCDAIVELDFNTYKKRYEVRLIAVRPTAETSPLPVAPTLDWIVDYRAQAGEIAASPDQLVVNRCPRSWDELQPWFRRAIASQQTLAIAYPPPSQTPPHQIWQQLVGIAKYLSRTGQSTSRSQISQKLGISDRTLQLGLNSLAQGGFHIEEEDQTLWVSQTPTTPDIWQTSDLKPDLDPFWAAIAEEQFRQQYFAQVPLATIQAVAQQTVINHAAITPVLEEPQDVA